jgi:tRNA (guanine-N1)-methyltransferase
VRIDVVSIFPDYLAPLELSLPGRARASGLLDIAIHDLRDWAVDRHRTVDDTPYGGGAGMVMKPEPWGAALADQAPDGAVLVVPTPAGETFTQSLAAELSTRTHLVFACGRYEGIDQRVLDDAASRMEVREISLGDYVLNGGEVAALAIIEAVVRLLPGFMGNAESIVEESHADGMLEYPVYTKPASRFPTCCCLAITRASPRGGPSSRCAERSPDVPTCGTPRQRWTAWTSGWSNRAMSVSSSPSSVRAGSRNSRRTRTSRSRPWPKSSATSSTGLGGTP